MADSLLRSLTPTENKVKAIVLADLAVTAASRCDYDRAGQLADEALPLAMRTETSLACDRLWELTEQLPPDAAGSVATLRERVTTELLAAPRSG